jgi:hypothetical protein
MVRKPTLMAGLVLIATTLMPPVAEAATMSPMTTAAGAGASEGSLAHQAHYGRYRRWDNDYELRRYPHYRYYRPDYYYRDRYYDRCRYWRHECARRWGRGGWEFRRCLWRHDCGGGYRY